MDQRELALHYAPFSNRPAQRMVGAAHPGRMVDPMWCHGNDDPFQQLHVVVLGKNAVLDQPVILQHREAGRDGRDRGGGMSHQGDRTAPSNA
mgnify:CR=1 FL=1